MLDFYSEDTLEANKSLCCFRFMLVTVGVSPLTKTSN